MPTIIENEPKSEFESWAAAESPLPDQEACRRAVSRIVKSKNFEKAVRLSALLKYVCELALEGRSSEISELTIGVAVFSRSENYNTSDDNIVRSTMRLLRQRLERYYAEEGIDDPTRIEIPRGAYVPIFSEHRHTLAAADSRLDPVTLAAVAIDAGVGRRRFSWLQISGAGILLLGALATTFQAGQNFHLFHESRVDRFWHVVFPKDRDTLLVPADTMLMMYERATHQSVPLDEYVSGNFSRNGAEQDDGLLASLQKKRYTAVTSVGIAASLGRTAATQRAPKVTFSRDLHLADLKQSNVILIGAEQNNPWVHLFRPHLNFHLDWSGVDDRFRVLNDHPLNSEPAEWNWSKEDVNHRGYGQIAFLPNLGGQGHVLIIAGTSMDGTQAAAEFLMDPKRMDPILQQAGEQGGAFGGFEILLLAKVLDHGTLTSTPLGIRFYRLQ